jgi:hypothetical protein
MKKILLVLFYLILVLIVASSHFSSYSLFAEQIDIPAEIQSIFLNYSTREIINNYLSQNIRNIFLDDIKIHDDLVSEHLIINEIISILRRRFRKFRFIQNEDEMFFRHSGFTFFFEYDEILEKPYVSRIEYEGTDSLYNYIFNDDTILLSSENIKKILLNYFIVKNDYFNSILKKYDDSVSKILYGDIVQRLNLLLEEDDFNSFLNNFFILSQYYIQSFRLEKFYQFLNNNFESIKHKMFIQDFLDNTERIAYYNVEDNFDKLRLYYFYKQKKTDLFDIYFLNYFKKYSNSSNDDILILYKYDLWKKAKFFIDQKSFQQLIHFHSKYVAVESYYIELLYSMIMYNTNSELLKVASEQISNLDNDLRYNDFVKFFESLIIHNKRNWVKAIEHYRNLHIEIVSAGVTNQIRNLIENILRNQILRDEYVFMPSFGFDIIKTLDGIIIKEVFDNNGLLKNDILISIDNENVSDYFDFLILLNSKKIGTISQIKILRENELHLFEVKVADYVRE